METTYMVGGLSCARCLVELMDGVRGVRGVDSVAVDLVRVGTGFWLWADERLDEMEVAG